MERQYIRSERAHFMCPNMHFGIVVRIAAEYKLENVQRTLKRIAAAHPVLNCMIAQDKNNELYYGYKGESTISLMVCEGKHEFWEDYYRIGKEEWNVFEKGLLKVFVYPENREEFQILFIAHHLLCDGRALLQLAVEFSDWYIENKNPMYVKEQLISSISDLPEKSSLSGISKVLVKRVNHLWRKEKQAVSYTEYEAFVKQFVKKNPFGYVRNSMPENRLLEIKELCHDRSVSVNDYLLAVLFQVTNTNKIVIGVDARRDIACYRSGAIANYSSAVGITYKNKNSEITQRVMEIHQLIEKYRNDKKKWLLVLACYLDMDANLIDAAAIATLGEFKSKVAQFVGSSMFGFSDGNGVSMTNLGSINNKNILSAVFIPPLSPSAKEVIGVLTTNGKMEIVGSFYREKISEEEVQRHLKFLVK